MIKEYDRDTRYFIDIEIETLKVTNHGNDHKDNLHKGMQTDPEVHRLFLTKGQYNKFIERCELKP